MSKQIFLSWIRYMIYAVGGAKIHFISQDKMGLDKVLTAQDFISALESTSLLQGNVFETNIMLSLALGCH